MLISIPRRSKKLLLVSTTFTLVTKDSEEVIFVSAKELEQVTFIQYPITISGSVT